MWDNYNHDNHYNDNNNNHNDHYDNYNDYNEKEDCDYNADGNEFDCNNYCEINFKWTW